MPNKNEPLLLRPSGKDYLWGGSRLNDEFEKNIDMTPLAETWECSTHPDGPSYVVGGAFDGQELAEVLKTHPEYLGERHKGENALPILIKFIDAKKDLSVPGASHRRLRTGARERPDGQDRDVVCAGCRTGCKAGLWVKERLHKGRNAQGDCERHGDEISAKGPHPQG